VANYGEEWTSKKEKGVEKELESSVAMRGKKGNLKKGGRGTVGGVGEREGNNPHPRGGGKPRKNLGCRDVIVRK